MPDSLESALIIQLAGTLKWSAALPPVNEFTGTLTGVDPGKALDITQYARRDREFQHRDMIAAAAVAKVAIHARTVWNGTVTQPVLQGVTRVTDQSGTNVIMPLDPTQVGVTLPNDSTAIQYVLNTDVPYAAIEITDVNLYNRDLLLYETLARAAAIFNPGAPISEIDPSGQYIGSTSIWATAQGVDRPKVPNAAEPLSQPTLKDPDLYLAERDNQVAGYVARVVQALKNPFAYATRIYVQINSDISSDVRESETYVLTNNVFTQGSTYSAGDQVLFQGVWYEANNTTTDAPPSMNWTVISAPTKLQFLADPSLDSRNRIVYDLQAKTLQWFRETLDSLHVPQIAGFLIPGILPGQTIQTLPAVPEQKDAQFYRQKASRISLAEGTYSNQQVVSPTGNRDSTSSVTYISGATNSLFQENKCVTLMMPDTFALNLQGLICSSGTYALQCLVRPSPSIEIAGGDNDQGSVDPVNGGTDYNGIGDVRNWEVPLPAGGWKLFIDFSNLSATPTTAFGIKASQGSTSILANTLPLYYTDNNGNALPQNTVVESPGIDIQSTGQVYNFNIQWTAGVGQFAIRKLRFVQVNGPDTSHYIMQASWIGASGSNQDAISSLDVIGQANTPDMMPFVFNLTAQDTEPVIQVTWLPKAASAWQSRSYNPGDQVIYNLIYWQASVITAPTDVPGQSTAWFQLGSEPQIPLVFEQVQLTKLIKTEVTPNAVGFQGFRQDMLERALRADEDAYTLALSRAGTNSPEFRNPDGSWTLASSGSWMSFMEVYAPRLREAGNIVSGGIVQGRQYRVDTLQGEIVIYNGGTFVSGQKFYGVSTSTYEAVGNPSVTQVGAYRQARPEDVGRTGLIPAGIEYIRFVGTGTVHGWYPSYASYPTHQAIQPWMIERGFYATNGDFDSPDGNTVSPGSAENPIPNFGNEEVLFIHLCDNGTLGFEGSLPSWITFDSSDSELVGAPDSFFGRTQGEANQIAQASLNAFGTEVLNSGDMFCPVGPAWGNIVWTLEDDVTGGGPGGNGTGSYSGGSISVAAKGNGSPSGSSRALGTLSYTGPQAHCRVRVTVTAGPTVYMGFFIQQDGVDKMVFDFGTNSDPHGPGFYEIYFTIDATAGSTLTIKGTADISLPSRLFIYSFDNTQGAYSAVIENVV